MSFEEIKATPQDIEFLANAFAKCFVNEPLLTLEDIKSVDLDAMVTSVGGWEDPFGQLASWFGETFGGVGEWIVDSLAGVFDALIKPIQDFLNWIWGGIQSIGETLSGIADSISKFFTDAVRGFIEWVSGALPSIMEWFEGVGKFFTEDLPSYLTAVGKFFTEDLPNLFSGVVDWVQKNIAEPLASWINENIVKPVSDFFKGVYDWFTKDLPKYLGGIADFFTKTLPQWFADVGRWFTEELPKLFSGVVEWVQKNIAEPLWSWINENVVKPVGDFFGAIYKWFTEDLPKYLSGVADFFTKTLPEWVGAVGKFFTEDLPKFFTETLPKLAGDFLKGIADWFNENVVKPVGDFFAGVVKWFTEDLPQILANLPQWAVQAIENVGKWIWEHLPDWFKDFISKIPDAFNAVATTFQGFINALLNIPKWFEENLVKPITTFFTETVPNWFYENIAKPISDAISGIGKALGDFFLKTLPSAIIEAGKWIWEQLQGLGQMIWEGLKGLGGMILNGIKGLGEFLWNAFKGIAKAIADFIKGAGEWFYNTFVAGPFESVGKGVAEAFMEATKTVAVQGEFAYMFSLWKDFVGNIALICVPLCGLVGALESIKGLDFELCVEPIGLGGKGAVKVEPTVMFKEMTMWIKETLISSFAGMFMGLAMNVLEPYRYLYRVLYREQLNALFKERGAIEAVYELPPAKELIEFIRRYLPYYLLTDQERKTFLAKELNFEEVYNYARSVSTFYGLPSKYVDTLFLKAEDLALKLKDRFGAERQIPLGIMFELPTHSEVARMLQRDILPNIPSMYALASIRGMNKDLALFTYLMTFKYPSFDKLWQFAMRSISGMLWFKPTETIKTIFEKEAEAIKAGKPIPPLELNYQGEKVFTALGAYLKWLEYANFSWFTKNTELHGVKIGEKVGAWTADSWLMWDIASDIPTKIDARWMTKWGLFDFLALKVTNEEVKVGQPVKAFPTVEMTTAVRKVIEDQLATSILMDLRPFCRLLQATGLHPAWVPITAVAEAINALTDERTLLRTGFLNLFKEGFWDYESIDKLLAGFFIASFAIEYYDIEKHEWKAGAINVPVKFLPAERRLLELRAVMDRALDILRDLAREAGRAYAENILIEMKNFEETVKTAVGKANEWFKSLMKEITGKELALKFDESYWETYAHVLELYRDIFTYRRVRYWVQRITAWAIYRIAYGYLTAEDIQAFINTFKDAARLTDKEVEVLTDMISVIAGIAKKEYIPTPLTLASMVEYVPEVRNFVDQVLEARGVPEAWRPIWKNYINIRPIISDVKTYVSRVEKLFEYFLISEDAYKKVLDSLKPYGYEDAEINLMLKSVSLERAYRAFQELLGTPRELTTMAEYSPKARQLAIARVEQLINALPVDENTKQFIKEMWNEYIRNRPIYDEVESYARELVEDYASGSISWDMFEKEIEALKQWGLDQYEIDFYKWIAQRKRERYAVIYGR
ncbi:MAG: hypothetical protein DRJ60_00410 [Thermoprotei archaeon]|nr:MAG: hypothetical protein DRJ60_00410 [Thermoprotei archaeon]